MPKKISSSGTLKKMRREQAQRASIPWRQKSSVDARMKKLLKELSPEERQCLLKGLNKEN